MSSVNFRESELYCDVRSLVEQNGQRFLPVELAGQTVLLEMRNVSSEPENPTWIAYFDGKIQEHTKVGAKEIAERLIFLQADVIITPSSEKSTKMVADAQILSSGILQKPVDRIIFQKGELGSEEMKKKKKEAVFSKKFKPITKKKDQLMVVSQENLDALIGHIQQGHRIVIVDDVYSTGETIRTIQYLLQKVYKKSGNKDGIKKPPIITVMRECERNSAGDLEMTEIPGLFTAIITPVIIGDLI